MKCPTIPGEWRAISDKFMETWNFPHTCDALDGKHGNCKRMITFTTTIKGFSQLYSWRSLMLITNSSGGMGSASEDLQCLKTGGMR